jgi:hypothetical protein
MIEILERQASLDKSGQRETGLQRQIPALSTSARLTASAGDPAPLRNGIDRPVKTVTNAWTGPLGSRIEYTFDNRPPAVTVRAVFDSDLNDRDIRRMPCFYPLSMRPFQPPAPLVRDFRIETLTNSAWQPFTEITDNHRRMITIPIPVPVHGVAIVPTRTWGGNNPARLFAFDVGAYL